MAQIRAGWRARPAVDAPFADYTPPPKVRSPVLAAMGSLGFFAPPCVLAPTTLTATSRCCVPTAREREPWPVRRNIHL